MIYILAYLAIAIFLVRFVGSAKRQDRMEAAERDQKHHGGNT